MCIHIPIYLRMYDVYVCARANVVYRGLECAQCPGGGRVPSLLDVPGVSAAGWTAAHLYKGSGSTDRDRQSLQNRLLTAFLKTIFDKIKALKDSKHFLSPLNEVSFECTAVRIG